MSCALYFGSGFLYTRAPIVAMKQISHFVIPKQLYQYYSVKILEPSSIVGVAEWIQIMICVIFYMHAPTQ